MPPPVPFSGLWLKNPEALKVIRRFFKKLGREMTVHQEKQALVPEGANIFDNKRGSAPGFALRYEKCLFTFLPGVPLEMEFMLRSSVLPLLREMFPEVIPWHQKTFKLLGLPESSAERMLESLGLPDLFQVAICVKFPFVHIKLSLRDKEGGALLNRAAAQMRAVYDEDLVAEDEETLAGNVAGTVDALRTNPLTGGVMYRRLDRQNAHRCSGLVRFSGTGSGLLLQPGQERMAPGSGRDFQRSWCRK